MANLPHLREIGKKRTQRHSSLEPKTRVQVKIPTRRRAIPKTTAIVRKMRRLSAWRQTAGNPNSRITLLIALQLLAMRKKCFYQDLQMKWQNRTFNVDWSKIALIVTWKYRCTWVKDYRNRQLQISTWQLKSHIYHHRNWWKVMARSHRTCWW